MNGVKSGLFQLCLSLRRQGTENNAFGGLLRGAIALAGTLTRTPEPAGIAHIQPIGGTINGAVKILRIDEGF